MPKKPSATGTTVRTAAGLIPLALAVFIPNAVLPGGGPIAKLAGGNGPAVCSDEISDFQACHTDYPSGCSPSAKYDAALNVLKNRLVAPDTAPVAFLGKTEVGALESKLPKTLTKNNHGALADDLKKLGEGSVYGVQGYLYYTKAGGKESSNCGLEGADAIDFHIAIGFDPALAAKIVSKTLTDADNAALKKTSMVVEMTPHYRFEYKPDWTLAEVQAVVGKQVRVTGQLIVDNEHYDSKDDCGLGDTASCWRATIWELHPVTQFEYCSSAGPCDDGSPSWVPLGKKPVTTP